MFFCMFPARARQPLLAGLSTCRGAAQPLRHGRACRKGERLPARGGCAASVAGFRPRLPSFSGPVREGTSLCFPSRRPFFLRDFSGACSAARFTGIKQARCRHEENRCRKLEPFSVVLHRPRHFSVPESMVFVAGGASLSSMPEGRDSSLFLRSDAGMRSGRSIPSGTGCRGAGNVFCRFRFGCEEKAGPGASASGPVRKSSAGGRAYFVPKMRSPASPRPGRI